MITESLANIFGWKTGFLLHEGFQVKCAGTPSEDGPVDRHLICTLDDHLPNIEAHAIGNAEFTDDLWITADGQQGIDWSNPICQLCKKGIAP